MKFTVLSLLFVCLTLSSCGTSTKASISMEENLGITVKPITPEQIAHQSIKVAAVQLNSPWRYGHPPDPENLPADTIIPYIDRAGADQADLVVFPELFLGMFKVPSPQTDMIAEAARRNSIYVMVGCFEVIDEMGNFGNSTLIFDRQGDIIGRFFKVSPAVGATNRGWPPMDVDPEWLMIPGEEYPVFDLDFGRVGIMTCYDGMFPEIPRILALKGAEILIWPNARGGSLEDYVMRTVMFQNYMHVVAVNKAYGSGTAIAEWPNGIKVRAEEPKEEYLLTELGLAHLRGARIHAREYIQRSTIGYDTLMENISMEDLYGFGPDDVVPEPDRKQHADMLEKLGMIEESHRLRESLPQTSVE